MQNSAPQYIASNSQYTNPNSYLDIAITNYGQLASVAQTIPVITPKLPVTGGGGKYKVKQWKKITLK